MEELGHMIRTTFPTDDAAYTVGCPTLNRWGDIENDTLGSIATFTKSAVDRLVAARWEHQSRIVIADGSQGRDVPDLRARNLSHATKDASHAPPIYVLTPELQAEVAHHVQKRTDLSRHIIAACLTDTGYASQRAKLDYTQFGKFGSFDDDTFFPDAYPVVSPSTLPHDMQPAPNSYLIARDEHLDAMTMDQKPNSIESFFMHLGKTVADMRKEHPNLRATEWEHDTMNVALQEARDGVSAQFMVTHGDESDIADADTARFIAACGTKHGIPDYRTIQIARFYLQEHFPDLEVPVKAVPSGTSEYFGFQRSNTNVDSAAFARLMDDHTRSIPWWFVSSDAISRRNPLQTVTGHYRADNELLPFIMGVISNERQQFLYLSGLQTHVYHNRARSGYRPNMHEQATASLVGNIAATEAVKRLSIDPSTMKVDFEPVHDAYAVPEECAKDVYLEIKSMADICEKQMKEMSTGSGPVSQAILEQYRDVYQSVKGKLGGFDFSVFRKHLNEEIRDQLRFFEEFLQAHAVMNEIVHDLIRKGKYPVEQFVSAKKTRSPVNGSANHDFSRDANGHAKHDHVDDERSELSHIARY